jgi:hypothetical protein
MADTNQGAPSTTTKLLWIGGTAALTWVAASYWYGRQQQNTVSEALALQQLKLNPSEPPEPPAPKARRRRKVEMDYDDE